MKVAGLNDVVEDEAESALVGVGMTGPGAIIKVGKPEGMCFLEVEVATTLEVAVAFAACSVVVAVADLRKS